jgi:hypothetical protein
MRQPPQHNRRLHLAPAPSSASMSISMSFVATRRQTTTNLPSASRPPRGPFLAVVSSFMARPWCAIRRRSRWLVEPRFGLRRTRASVSVPLTNAPRGYACGSARVASAVPSPRLVNVSVAHDLLGSCPTQIIRVSFVDQRLLTRYDGSKIGRRLEEPGGLDRRDDCVRSVTPVADDEPSFLERSELLAGRPGRHSQCSPDGRLREGFVQ